MFLRLKLLFFVLDLIVEAATHVSSLNGTILSQKSLRSKRCSGGFNRGNQGFGSQGQGFGGNGNFNGRMNFNQRNMGSNFNSMSNVRQQNPMGNMNMMRSPSTNSQPMAFNPMSMNPMSPPVRRPNQPPWSTPFFGPQQSHQGQRGEQKPRITITGGHMGSTGKGGGSRRRDDPTTEGSGQYSNEIYFDTYRNGNVQPIYEGTGVLPSTYSSYYWSMMEQERKKLDANSIRRKSARGNGSKPGRRRELNLLKDDPLVRSGRGRIREWKPSRINQELQSEEMIPVQRKSRRRGQNNPVRKIHFPLNRSLKARFSMPSDPGRQNQQNKGKRKPRRRLSWPLGNLCLRDRQCGKNAICTECGLPNMNMKCCACPAGTYKIESPNCFFKSNDPV